ncbi:MAG: double-strand break repair protein AddB [Pseudomonadota bacterium]
MPDSPSRDSVPNLYTIGPHVPFLRRLAESWLDGALNVGPTDDPLRRIDTVFYLPTRRAARAFAATIAELAGGAALLPQIRTLADADDEEFLTPSIGALADDGEERAVPSELLEPPTLATMPTLRRRLLLTRLIEAAGEAMRRSMQSASVAEQPIFPQSLAESAYLAKALGDLIDQVATEEADWKALFDLVPQDHAAYWQLTLTLLTLVTQNWPAILAEEGLIDPATRRRLVLDARTARAFSGGHKGPIIAAGSTGSIPATARFLAAVARANQGAVVLPGLDLAMPDAAFDLLTDDTPESASHPQAGLSTLLEVMGAKREICTDLTPDVPPRQSLVSSSLLPARATSLWSQLRPNPHEAGKAFEGVQLVEAMTESDEALAIAMAMRASIVAGETVALVTPDRALSRRVAHALERFDLASDDSAGTPLNQTPPARLMLLASQAWQHGFAAIPLLSLLKHPLCALGRDPVATRVDARLLEQVALRGIALPPGLDALRQTLATRAQERDDRDVRQPALRRSLGTGEDDKVAALLDRLEQAFAPLVDPASDFSGFTENLFEVCDQLASTGEDTPNPLYAGPAGEALAGLRQELRACQSVGLEADGSQAVDLFAALLNDQVVRPTGLADPRLNIWGPLEARLQAVDHVVLGGLNETAWPALPSASPFLSRAMQAGLGLAIPERRIGLSAHDVEQALGMPKVTLTRARKVDGAPTVASRWLQRLVAFLPEETVSEMKARGNVAATLAERWDQPDQVVPRPRPEPRPAAPPTQLSITEVETLIRDPYSIYARRVLRLEEAPGIGLPPGAAERGTLFHALFEELAPRLDAKSRTAWRGVFDEAARALIAILDPFPDVQALWQRRISGIADPYLAQEAAWSEGLTRRHGEQAGKLDLTVAGKPCTLTGRADRIDVYGDGSAAILDFKTGSVPSKKQVEAGLAPQLPLTAAMVSAGAFGEVGAHSVRAARYMGVGSASKPVDVRTFEGIHDLGVDALEQLEALWATYLLGAPFLPLVRAESVRYTGSFHHLARVKEWRAAEEVEG